MDAPPAAAAAPAAPPAGAAPVNSPAALPPYLEDWGPEHVKQWRDLLPETDRKKFQEFFASLPPEADGEDLASYDKEDIKAFFTTLENRRAYAPVLYARLQKLKRQANAGNGGSSDDYARKTYELVYKLAAKDEERQSHVSISDINAEKGEQLRATLRVVVRSVMDESCGTKREKRFAWSDATERSHAAYILWLKEALGSPKSVKILDGNKYPQLLSTAAAGSLPFRLVGTTDVAIVDFASHGTNTHKAGLVIAMELKKKVEPAHIEQAIGQLAAADYNSQHTPIVVLTDLNNYWQFFWFEKDGEQAIVRTTRTSQQKAFEWLRQRCDELAPRRERHHGRKKARYPSPWSRATRVVEPPYFYFPDADFVDDDTRLSYYQAFVSHIKLVCT